MKGRLFDAGAMFVLLGALLAALLIPSCGDGNGTSGSSEPPPFAVDFRSPAPGDGKVARTATVYVGFNRPVNGLTVSSATVFLSTGSTMVPSTVAFQACNQIAVLEPSATLLANTIYTVFVTDGILDVNQTPLIPDKFTFTTGSFIDVGRPSFEGVVAVSLIGTSALVTWANAVDNEDPFSTLVYDVFESTVSKCYNFGSPIASTAPGAIQVTVPNISTAQPTYFVVRARDRSGNVDQNTHEVALNPGAGTISFAANVWPIVTVHCQGCHTIGVGSQQVPNMPMYTPSSTYLSWVNVDATCPSLPLHTRRVLPGASSVSFLYQKLWMSVPPCGQQMPLFSAPLSDSDIQTIKVWIDQGAPNN